MLTRTLRALQDRAGREWSRYPMDALIGMLEIGQITRGQYHEALQKKRRAEYLEDVGRSEKPMTNAEAL